MKILLFLILVFLVSPCWLPADESPHRMEITVYSGISFLHSEIITEPCPICEQPAILPFDSRQSLDGSILIGFKAGYFLNSRMEVEGNFTVAPNNHFHSETGFICPPGKVCPELAAFPFFFMNENVVSYYYDGNFAYHLADGKVRPFFTTGIGGVSTAMDDGVHSDFSINFGGGAKFYMKHVGLRFEVNDHVISEHFLSGKNEHDLQVLYGFLFQL